MKSNLKWATTLRGDGERLLSQPLRLHWNGWESDTCALQSAGWELSVKEDLQYNRMCIAIRHKQNGIRGISDSMDWDYWRQMKQQFQDPRSLPMFGCRLASDIIVTHHGAGGGREVDFNPIDARPMYATTQSMSIDDLAHFRKLEKPGDEIYLRKASMAEIMEMALSKQEPDQDRIRKQMVRDQELQVMRNSKLKANLRLVA